MLPTVLDQLLAAIEHGEAPVRDRAVVALAQVLQQIRQSGAPLRHPLFDNPGEFGLYNLQPYIPQNLQPYDPPNTDPTHAGTCVCPNCGNRH